VNKKWMLKGAALCALAMLAGSMAAAEEKRLGDYIYVPAMQVAPVSGSISLRVEGMALSEHSDEPVVEKTLSGAEFGVYVFSSSGELTPWANPLYPSEPMRIRSAQGGTRFSLPQGAEYYLRQESAPQGYAFDDETLIPITGDEIVVANHMAGQLVVSTVDSLGSPVSGVQILLEDDNGQSLYLSRMRMDRQSAAVKLHRDTLSGKEICRMACLLRVLLWAGRQLSREFTLRLNRLIVLALHLSIRHRARCCWICV